MGMGFGRVLWRELLWPSRYAWTGLAALWVAMLVINAQLSEPRPSDAGARAESSQEMRQAWEEQNRVLALLIQPTEVVPAPPPGIPRPRSQKARDWTII
jgi:hypothetical protein